MYPISIIRWVCMAVFERIFSSIWGRSWNGQKFLHPYVCTSCNGTLQLLPSQAEGSVSPSLQTGLNMWPGSAHETFTHALKAGVWQARAHRHCCQGAQGLCVKGPVSPTTGGGTPRREALSFQPCRGSKFPQRNVNLKNRFYFKLWSLGLICYIVKANR